jgi:uncharacterized protein YeaO (DUF488 family)
MIYTSYYNNLRNIQRYAPNVVPVSISIYPPDWYTGLTYSKLAPKRNFFNEWKINHDNDFYVKEFNKQVLSNLDPKEVAKELYEMSNQSDLVLLCYEKPNEFCHRHLVADWLRDVTLVEEVKINVERRYSNGKFKNNRNYRRYSHRK